MTRKKTFFREADPKIFECLFKVHQFSLSVTQARVRMQTNSNAYTKYRVSSTQLLSIELNISFVYCSLLLFVCLFVCLFFVCLLMFSYC